MSVPGRGAKKQSSRRTLGCFGCGGVLVFFCVTGIIFSIIITSRQREALDEADRLYAAGNRGDAVVKYKQVYTAAGTRMAEVIQRIVDFEVEQNNEDQAREWIEIAINEKLEVAYQSIAAKNLHRAVLRERDERATREKAEAAAKLAAAQQKQKENLDRFMKNVEEAHKNSDQRVVARISVSEYTARITVDNSWHVVSYQIRLQVAQNLWKAWADIASPKDLDKARIELVDFNDNEVGGSRAWGGSLIWVQKE